MTTYSSTAISWWNDLNTNEKETYSKCLYQLPVHLLQEYQIINVYKFIFKIK